MVCWRYLHGEGFVASSLARTSGFWNFLAVTYIWISALEGAPPPDSLLQSHKADFFSFSPSFSLSELHCSAHDCESNPSVFPVTPIRAESSEILKQHFLAVSLLQTWSEGRKKERERQRQKASLKPYSSCCMRSGMWSTQSGFHPQCPTLAEIQWIGSRPVTFNSLCRFYALPPVWPICSPENSLDVSAKAALNPIIRP